MKINMSTLLGMFSVNCNICKTVKRIRAEVCTNNCICCHARFRKAAVLDDDMFSSAFCENSEKLIDVHLFALAAEYYSLSNLGVCTPLEDVLEALKGSSQGASGIKLDEFMNNKKSHEVQVMSELVDSIANYCGIKQVIDIGSGKGYLSSFLSMQYNLKVYGIDSSNSNTNGAHERNRKLKKHWRAYQSRGRANLKTQSLEKTNDRPVESEMKYKTINEEFLNNTKSLQSRDHAIMQDLVPSCGFTEMGIFETRTETEADLVAQTKSHEGKLSEEVLDTLNVLPADAVEVFSSSHCNWGELSEEEKVQRKMTSLKTKATKSSESNLYLPLTSCITAETELSDIITDLEDCVMVGLHTCGDLAANTLRIFAAKPEIKAVCSVGCCYHLLSEQFENQEGLVPPLPGEPVRMPNHPLGEEPFPTIQPKPPLTQLLEIPLGPVSDHHREEISVCPSSSPHKEGINGNEVSPQAPLLQAEQTK
ncbi:methyltransferase-like protein 25 isoform X1 [Pitangus sulphuratus]|nr:methyltransferase-like protein 25 isoform X1 [Pitangus sulphuratus]